jgi:ASC-1-like (ASCH) protein
MANASIVFPIVGRKNIREPWFSAIVDGLKTYEGRLNRDFWKSLTLGQHFVAYTGQREATLQVTDRQYFSTFGEAWDKLKGRLIPPTVEPVTTPEEADAVYSAFFTDEEVQKHGVVALGIKVEALREIDGIWERVNKE